MIIDDIKTVAKDEYLRKVDYKMAIKRTKNPLVKLGNWITILIMILGLMPDTIVIRVITTILWVMVIPGMVIQWYIYGSKALKLIKSAFI